MKTKTTDVRPGGKVRTLDKVKNSGGVRPVSLEMADRVF
jgi:hypothetical protein